MNLLDPLDIRIGTIIQADPFPEARNPAYKLKIDFGELGIKKSSAQITRLYTPEELTGRQIAAVVNVSPKQIANFMSECLVIGIPGENGEVVLLQPERNIPDGSRLS